MTSSHRTSQQYLLFDINQQGIFKEIITPEELEEIPENYKIKSCTQTAKLVLEPEFLNILLDAGLRIINFDKHRELVNEFEEYYFGIQDPKSQDIQEFEHASPCAYVA